MVDFGKNFPKLLTWEQYCKDLGLSKRIVNMWLQKWFGPEKEIRTEILPLPEGEYNVIYADPPWQYDNKIMKWGAAELHYPTLSIEELSAMTIPAANNAVLFLWVTNPFIEDALKVVKAWGFEYKTNMVFLILRYKGIDLSLISI